MLKEGCASSYFDLQVRLFPKIDASVISIATTYAGADAALMEGFITTPIENALGSIDGIDYIELVPFPLFFADRYRPNFFVVLSPVLNFKNSSYFS